MTFFQPLSGHPIFALEWLIMVLTLLLWLLTLVWFLHYRRRNRKRLHKLKGRLAVKNHHTAKAMLNSEEKFRKIIGQMNEGLLLTDEHHTIIFSNTCACGILKMPKEEIIGKKVEDLAVGALDASRIKEAMEVKKTGCTTREEVRLVKGSNEMFWASLSVSYPVDLKEVTGGAIIVLVDITHHISLEQKLQKLTSSLVQKVKQLNCLFEVQQVLSEPDTGHDEMFRHLIRVIPRGLRYEGDMAVEIMLSGQRYASGSYRETRWTYQAPLRIKGVKAGYLSVSYIGPEPSGQKKPFRIGEKVLVKNIAEKISLAL